MSLKDNITTFTEADYYEGHTEEIEAFNAEDVKNAVLEFWKDMSQDERLFSVEQIRYIQSSLKLRFGDFEE